MNLDDTKIPAGKQTEFYAALAKMRTFEKTAVFGKCVFESGNCVHPPISSHLLSESWLRKIADSTNHVMQFECVASNVARNGASIEARRVGVGQKTAVTFPGFCKTHDTEIFRCLEQASFSATPEQLLALTYRSTCRVTCAKYQMVACHLPRALDQDAQSLFTIQTVNEMKRFFLLWKLKLELESMVMNGKNELVGYVVKFAELPSLLASDTFSYPLTFTGKKLDERYEWLTLSILPSINGGYAVFTWSKRAPKNPSRLVKSFEAIPPELQSTALMNLVLELSETFCVAPGWWNSLSEQSQTDLLKRFARSLVSCNPAPPVRSLLPKTPPLVDWNVVNSGYV